MNRWPKLIHASLLLALAVASLAVSPAVLSAQTTTESLDALAKRIAEKRSELERLSDEVDLAKSQFNEELRSIQSQIADVDIQINRENIRLRQIGQELDRARERIQISRSAMVETSSVLDSTIAALRSYISEGLPFQTKERLAELDTVERVVADGSVEVQTGLTRLWNMVESEFRLSSESGLYRQVVLVEGREQLAEVARLGMTALYFKTFDERYGVAYKDGTNWSYRILESRDDQTQISLLFDSLRRNMREGFFTVTNPAYGADR